MTKNRNSNAKGRARYLLFLVAGTLLFACQLPSTILEWERRTDQTRPPTPTISPTYAGRQPQLITPTSIKVSPTSIYSEDGAYPSPSNLSQPTIPSAGSEYPNISATPPVYPGAGDLVSATPSPSFSSDANGYPQPPSNETQAYPGLSSSSTVVPTQTTSAAGNPYPLENTGSPTSSPTVSATGSVSSRTPVTTVLPSLTPTFSSGNLPQATETKSPVATPSPTFFAPTQTPLPTRTPYLTPTPSLTFTPTPTRTPLPYPPWMNVQIQATDPSLVRIASGKPQLVEFFAYWSGPSLAMAPIVKGVQDEYAGRVNFVFLDIDNPATEGLKHQLHFQTEPEFILLDGQGKVLKEWVGYVTVEQFRQAIDSSL
jgi:thiol-disulfide isomerase/thioredoxin